ncbi:MAG TPA: LLM class flavin-dependent oxidoreductase [Acidimicrobiales bacterium]|nr:LLM class flavin-dependent oxidoreductase [Acidimicrobiales bacterium]
MHIGVMLPSFRPDADAALDGARRAEELGLDGVFVYDHLWPMGRPDRPALSAFPLLGALAAVTRRVCFGPLVARVGLVPEDVLVAELLSLHHMAPGRLVAALGTGDDKSRAENLAYGIAYPPADERRLALRRCATRLRDAGVTVWVGGGSSATGELAAELGVALNLWEGQPAALAAWQQRGEVTWAGPVPDDVPGAARWLDEVRRAGATWAVCAWPSSLEVLAEAARLER